MKDLKTQFNDPLLCCFLFFTTSRGGKKREARLTITQKICKKWN